MESNKQLLKSLTYGKGAAATKESALSKMRDTLRKNLKNVKPKQMVDMTIFAVGIFLMYKFGKAVAETIDNQMPTEKSMMDMMRQMQGPPGMPPPPM